MKEAVDFLSVPCAAGHELFLMVGDTEVSLGTYASLELLEEAIKRYLEKIVLCKYTLVDISTLEHLKEELVKAGVKFGNN